MNPCAPRCEFCGAPMVKFDLEDCYVQCRDQCEGFRAWWDEVNGYGVEAELGGEA